MSSKRARANKSPLAASVVNPMSIDVTKELAPKIKTNKVNESFKKRSSVPVMSRPQSDARLASEVTAPQKGSKMQSGSEAR